MNPIGKRTPSVLRSRMPRRAAPPLRLFLRLELGPEIAIGLSVLIPETYVADLQLRLGLYRRLSALETRAEIDAFAAELVDRFGELPAEVGPLLDVVAVKGLCRAAGIAKVDAGPKGAVVTFHRNAFANAQGLAQFLQTSRGLAKLQPDHRLVFKGDWDQPETRFKGVRGLVSVLAEIAAKGAKAA